MPRILCVGLSAYDIIASTDSYPQENKKYTIERMVTSGGGPSANAAYLLGKYGADVEYIGVLGNDPYGQQIMNEFDSVNVKTGNIIRPDSFETPLSIIIVNKSVGSRTIINARKIGLDFRSYLKKVDKPDIILFDGHYIDLAMEIKNRFPDAVCVIDAGSYKKDNVDLGKLVDYFVCSEDFAKKFLDLEEIGLEKMGDIMKTMSKTFPGKIVITLGDRGCIYGSGKTAEHMPAFKMNAIDTTAAGDIFHGAFVWGLAANFSFTDNLAFSSLCAGLSTEKEGGRSSIPELTVVLDAFKKMWK